MQSFPTKSHTTIQTYYQNASVANLYLNTSFMVAIIGILLTLKVVTDKERRAKKVQQQVQKLEKIYSLECKDSNR